ncbi:MAG: 4-(cytidine 5'-diphospho)-2-C-methyl-D-erythritol kinase [Solobacterium sp.]|nr:4-(cytidine 5'-diphospho)-2-C-methyl-D-erythritol kinase [Solobacterium sp.]
MKERAYAKINLCLDVVRKREDGYHDLKMVIVPIDFYDVLEMVPADETSISLNRRYLPVNEKNTVIKAYSVMRERYGFDRNFAFTLQKHIPTQAGLAGGSADAAAAIRMINKSLHLNLTTEEMLSCAKEVGADVPFCVLNKCALAEGIGENLTTFSCNPDFSVLLVKPGRGVSTKAAFGGLDFSNMEHPDPEKMMKALIEGDYDGIISSLGNSLESISLKLVSEISEVKEQLTDLGFDGVLMSGSGSAVFGITRSQRVIREASDIMRANGYFVRATKILGSGVH